MKKILNVSNHKLTDDQINELSEKDIEVVELDELDKRLWSQLTPNNYRLIADSILNKYAVDLYHLAGFPAAVVYVCNQKQNKCYYAFSERCSIEELQADGSVVKKNVFKHKGFYLY